MTASALNRSFSLLPDTSAENLTALLSNATIIEELDSRLLASEMESLCTEKDLQEAKAVHDQAAFVATEKALFEDYLINKYAMFPLASLAFARKSSKRMGAGML